jgi:NAD(P)-dependent dehydrogenase (short-subunit alcohol dehydrogenase family)
LHCRPVVDKRPTLCYNPLYRVDCRQSTQDTTTIQTVKHFSLDGKVAIVTGGSRGIGRAIALALAEAGARLVIASRTAADIERVAEEARAFGQPAMGVPTDVSRAGDIQQLVDQTLAAYGRVDILVNNAGISPVYSRALKLKEEDWSRILAVNLTGPFLACQAAGRVMAEQRQGKIINILSIGATTGLPRFIAYCAAKGGLLQVTRVLAQELADSNVQVNAIAPGYVETDMTVGLQDNPRLLNDILCRTPMRRLGRPDEVVGAALLLASDLSSYITGHILYVDGGWSAA